MLPCYQIHTNNMECNANFTNGTDGQDYENVVTINWTQLVEEMHSFEETNTATQILQKPDKKLSKGPPMWSWPEATVAPIDISHDLLNERHWENIACSDLQYWILWLVINMTTSSALPCTPACTQGEQWQDLLSVDVKSDKVEVTATFPQRWQTYLGFTTQV